MSYIGAERVICISNEEYPASLTANRVYTVLPDAEAMKHGFIRVVDDSGEDYLYPESFFLPAEPAKEDEQLRAQTLSN